MLTKERADEIVRAGIDSIKLSINAANKEDYALIHGKDEFDQVIKNLIYLHSLKKEKKKNLHYIYHMLLLVIHRKIKINLKINMINMLMTYSFMIA